jgi:hypothetical protein
VIVAAVVVGCGVVVVVVGREVVVVVVGICHHGGVVVVGLEVVVVVVGRCHQGNVVVAAAAVVVVVVVVVVVDAVGFVVVDTELVAQSGQVVDEDVGGSFGGVELISPTNENA